MVLAITSLSAFIRLARSGVGCTPWPACYGQFTRTTAFIDDGRLQPGASDGAVAGARAAHRVLASSSLPVILALLVLALRQGLRREARLAASLLALALFLAVLGAMTGSSRFPAVTLGNLLGGLAMFILSLRLALLAGSEGTPAHAPLAPWAWAALALSLLQVALGGLVSSGDAGLSCPAFGACDLGAASWRTLNPWNAPAAGTLPTHASGALVHLLHRAVGLALLALLALLAWRAERQARPWTAALLLGLPLLQVLLGLGLVAQQLPLAPTWAHNAGAALLLALLTWLTLAGEQREAP